MGAASATKQVDFFFDPISPYAWLATSSLPRLEQAGVRVRFVPVLFAGLLKAHGNLGPAEIPAKRTYLFRDVMREAARRGIPFSGPPGHPFNPLTALRMCTALVDDAERRTLALALIGACWEGGKIFRTRPCWRAWPMQPDSTGTNYWSGRRRRP